MGHSEPVFAQFRNLSALVVMKPSFNTPSIAIILPRSLRELFPIQRAAPPLVDKAYGEYPQEYRHRPESHHAHLGIGDRPWEQECDFQIEHDEQNSHQVVAHVEIHARVPERIETALVDRQLFGIRPMRPEHAPGPNKAAPISVATMMNKRRSEENTSELQSLMRIPYAT